MPDRPLSPARRALAMASLVLAGEAIFIPAFHPGRYFKSSLLSAFGIDEFQLGQLFALYGMVAMGAYLLGGPIADRFSPRRLLVLSLLVTGAGSLYMATIPGFNGLRALYAFWGLSTIVAFWAPLIRATRAWGGPEAQGRAFGLLDGGRGFAAAVIAALAAYGFSVWFGDTITSGGREQDVTAVRTMLWFYAGCCGAAAALVWCFVPDRSGADEEELSTGDAPALRDILRNILAVSRSPAIWLQALVVVAAYTAFKSFDYYGLYCEDAYGMSKSQSAGVVAWLSFLRVGATIAAGWVADRWLSVAGTVTVCFVSLGVSFLLFLLLPAQAGWTTLAVANMAVSCTAFFALRGIYFALLEEEGVPEQHTGVAVGLVSFVGFTPEIFAPLVSGWLVREARQAGDVLVGYNQLFGLLAVCSLIGLAAALLLWRRAKRSETDAPSG